MVFSFSSLHCCFCDSFVSAIEPVILPALGISGKIHILLDYGAMTSPFHCLFHFLKPFYRKTCLSQNQMTDSGIFVCDGRYEYPSGRREIGAERDP